MKKTSWDLLHHYYWQWGDFGLEEGNFVQGLCSGGKLCPGEFCPFSPQRIPYLALDSRLDRGYM